jgi:hypothetical protein
MSQMGVVIQVLSGDLPTSARGDAVWTQDVVTYVPYQSIR